MTIQKLIGATSLLLVSPAFAQPGFTLLPLLPGGGENPARAVSLDGKWVAGWASSAFAPWPQSEAYRWSAMTGIESLGPGPFQGSFESRARGISADGSVVVGQLTLSRAFRWTQPTGKVHLGVVPGYTNAHAEAVSADGNVIAGYGDGGPDAAFIWTPAGGFTLVPGFVDARALAISADGQVVVGRGRFPGPSGVVHAFRWVVGTPQPQSLGTLPGTETSTLGQAVSPDGGIVGGIVDLEGNWRVAVWTQEHGYTVLPGVAGRPFCNIYAVSVDGRVVAGTCQTHLAAGAAIVWIGPGPQGPYTAHNLNDYLPARGIQIPPNLWLSEIGGMTGDGRVLAGWGFTTGGAQRGFRIEFCYANCDNSTVQPYLNVDDFTCFINEFAAGCP